MGGGNVLEGIGPLLAVLALGSLVGCYCSAWWSMRMVRPQGEPAALRTLVMVLLFVFFLVVPAALHEVRSIRRQFHNDTWAAMSWALGPVGLLMAFKLASGLSWRRSLAGAALTAVGTALSLGATVLLVALSKSGR